MKLFLFLILTGFSYQACRLLARLGLDLHDVRGEWEDRLKDRWDVFAPWPGKGQTRDTLFRELYEAASAIAHPEHLPTDQEYGRYYDALWAVAEADGRYAEDWQLVREATPSSPGTKPPHHQL